MPPRRLITGLLLGAGSLAGTVLYRRRAARRRERVDLYYEDGSMTSLTEGSAGAEGVLPVARRVLETARQ